MATISCYPDIRYLEADTISEQAKVLEHVAKDIQYAASIFNYKAYDLDTKALRLRKEAWEGNQVRSDEAYEVSFEEKRKEELRVKQSTESMAMMVETAYEVKKNLKQLVEIACAACEAGQVTGIEDKIWKTSEASTPCPESAVFESFLLTPPLETELDNKVTQARRVLVKPGGFIPINFNKITSTPIRNEKDIYLTPDQTQRSTDLSPPPAPRKRRALDQEPLTPCHDATKALQSMLLDSPRRPRGRPPGAKNKPHVTTNFTLEVPIKASMKEHKTTINRATVPPTPEKTAEEMDKELLSWLPGKEDSYSSPLPDDEELIVMKEQCAKIHRQQGWAY